MTNSIYFPLWSNVDFFEDTSKQPDLIKRIKLSILMYDKLYFDYGILSLECNDYGSYKIRGPYKGSNPLPEEPTGDISLIGEFPQTGEVATLIPSGRGKSYNVSFEHLINEMGLADGDFIELRHTELTDYAKNLLKEVMNKTESYKDFINAPMFCKNLILENFHTSILSSLGVGPIMIDNIHQQLLNKVNINNVHLDLSIEILHRVNKLLSFKLPDFSLMKIDDILDLRKDYLFKKFRGKLFDINNILTKKDVDSLDESKIESLFLDEYLNEMKTFSPSKKDVVIDGGLGIAGLFPGVGTIASIAGLGKIAYDAKKVYDYDNSWVAFIMKY